MQSQANQLCSNCRLTPSTSFCRCQVSPFFLCLDCISLHYHKFPLFPHQIYPLSALHVDEQRFQQTYLKYNQGKTNLMNTVQGIETAIREFTQEIDRIMRKIEGFREEIVGKLMEMKGNIENEGNLAMEEVEKTLFLEDPELKSRLSKGLRDYFPGSLPEFRYFMDSNALEKALESVFTYVLVPPETEKSSIPSEESIFTSAGPYIPWISGGKISFFDCVSGSYTQDMQLQGGFASVRYNGYVLIDWKYVISCGGLNTNEAPIPSTYEITPLGCTSPLPDLQYARYLHGSIYLPSLHSLYVFGGMRGSAAHITDTPSCECLPLNTDDTSQWKALPKMQIPRKRFNPCWFGNLIFLCGSPNPVIETFDPVEVCMNVMTFRLPEQPSACILYVQNDELQILSDNFLSEYVFESDRIAHKGAFPHKRLAVLPNSAVEVYNGVVYVGSEAGVVEIEASTGNKAVRQEVAR